MSDPRPKGPSEGQLVISEERPVKWEKGAIPFFCGATDTW